MLIGFFVATTAGASVVIAQVYGANRTRDVQIAAGNAIAVFALLGVGLDLLNGASLREAAALLTVFLLLNLDAGEVRG